MEDTKKADNKLTVRITKDGSTSKKEVTFEVIRLSYGQKLKFKEKADIFEYAEVDTEKANEGGTKAFKSVDLKGWMKARKSVETELTQLLWGISDVSLDEVAAEDFDKMLKITIDADVLDFQKEEDEAKKKKEEQEEARMKLELKVKNSDSSQQTPTSK